MTVIMIVGMVLSYQNESFASLQVLFLFTVIGVYIIPLVQHYDTLKIMDFIKGSVYMVFMTPTFINIIVIYSICNIHDVSWGSRPSGANSLTDTARDKKMSIEYRNYRANFLCIWIILNIGCGYLIVSQSRRENISVLFVIACILMLLVGLKVLFSTLHIFTNYICNLKLKSHLKTKIGTIFDLTPNNPKSVDVYNDEYDEDSIEFNFENENINMPIHNQKLIVNPGDSGNISSVVSNSANLSEYKEANKSGLSTNDRINSAIGSSSKLNNVSYKNFKPEC